MKPQWIITEHPFWAFYATELTLPKLDGIPKITASVHGFVKQVNDITFHAAVYSPDDTTTVTHHEVFQDRISALAYVQNNVLSPPTQHHEF